MLDFSDILFSEKFFFVKPQALFLPQASSWEKISQLFVFVLYVALRKRISSKIRAFCIVLSN